jgi:hypothetical protein
VHHHDRLRGVPLGRIDRAEVRSKFVLDIAHEMHSDEALLATLAIVIWHFYNVHFNPERFPGTLMWWHGQISEHELKEEHPLEYEEMMAKRAKPAAEVTPQ